MAFYQKILLNIGLNRNGWFFMGIFFLLSSMLFFTSGIIIDLLIKSQLNSSQYEKRYYIREIIEKK
jgi:hypothetical protein